MIVLSLLLVLIIPLSGVLAKAKTTLNVWTLTEGDVNEYEQKVINAFEKAYPDIQIKLHTAENESYKTAIQVAIGSNNPPDIFFVWAGEYTGKFVRAKQVADLTKSFNSAWGKAFMKAALTPYTFGNKIYAVPYSVEAKYFFYNKVAFANQDLEAPRTWEELISDGQKLKTAGLVPIAFGVSEPWTGCHYISILNQKLVGEKTMMEDYELRNPKGKLFTNPGYVLALKKLKELQDKDLFNPSVTSVSNDMARALFFSSKSAMMFGGTWNMAVWEGINSAAPKDFKAKYGMFRMPVIKEGKGNQNYVLGAPIGFAISPKSKNLKQAQTFLQYFTSQKSQKQMVGELKRLPAVAGCVTSDNASDKLRWVSEDIEKADGMVGWLDTVLEISISNVYLNGIQAMLNGTSTPEQVMESVQKQAQKVQEQIGSIIYK